MPLQIDPGLSPGRTHFQGECPLTGPIDLVDQIAVGIFHTAYIKAEQKKYHGKKVATSVSSKNFPEG
jgi:hypothetical protein